jgi:glutamine synthetase
MTKAASAAAKDLAAAGVSGVHLAWAGNNGIPRSRIAPGAGLAGAATRGVGATSLFALDGGHGGHGGGGGLPTGEGAGYLAGLLRDLPTLTAITAITAPSVPSPPRLRPGCFAGACAFWGAEDREAPLRYIPGSPLPGAGHANVELKASDADPSLAFAAGMAGIEGPPALPEPIGEDPGAWTAGERESRRPADTAEQDAALPASPRVAGALGEEPPGALRASDAAWAAQRSADEIVAARLWRC